MPWEYPDLGESLHECPDLGAFIADIYYVFRKSCFNVDTTAKSVVFTEPHFNLASIQDRLDEILFVEYRFRNVYEGSTMEDSIQYFLGPFLKFDIEGGDISRTMTVPLRSYGIFSWAWTSST